MFLLDITTRRLNNLARFNYFLESVHIIFEDIPEEPNYEENSFFEISNFLLNGEALSCMYNIFPTENEVKFILLS
jgi:hypothetical protein